MKTAEADGSTGLSGRTERELSLQEHTDKVLEVMVDQARPERGFQILL